MSATLVCIDLGTTRLKVAAFTPEGALLQQVVTRHKETGDGQDPTCWWRDAVAAIRSLGVDNVAGLSLSGRGGAGIFLDRAGDVLAGPWADDRHAAELRRLYAWRSGRFLPNYGAALVAKYLWLREHDAGLARRCRCALYGKDYLLFRLTGAHVTDWSSGPDGPCWDGRLFEDFGLDTDLLPRPALPWEIAGGLTSAAARDTGLPEGTPVAVGAHDGICANVGAGAGRPGDYAITLGTNAVTRAVTSTVPPGAYRFYALPPDRHVIGGNALLGGRSLDWLLDILDGAERGADAYPAADARAAAVPPGAEGAAFLPFLAGQVAPEIRPGARGAFAGLRAEHGRDTLLRAVFEGTAFAVADIFEQVREWCGPPATVRLTGGGADSRLMRRLLADALNVTVEVSDSAVEARGAAVFLAVALGLYPDHDAAAHAMVTLTGRVAPEPEGVETCRRLHARWRAVRDAMRAVEA